MVERDLDHFGTRRRSEPAQRAGEIDPVEAQNDIDVFEPLDAFRRHRARRAEIERVVGRKARADFQVAQHARIERLGERDARLPDFRIARGAAGEDQHLLGAFEHGGRLLHKLRRRRGRDLRHVAGNVDRRQLLGDLGFLHLGVEIDIDGALRNGIGDPGAAQNGFARGARRGRLVVPFGIFADQRALIARGMDPVDPRPALDGIDRTGGAEHHHRHAVAPGVEHRHGRVHQPDIGMHRADHRLAGDLGIAVGDGDGGFLVQAEQHLRLRIAEIVDDAVVQAAIARAGRERDIGDVERAAARRRSHRSRNRGHWRRSASGARRRRPPGRQRCGRVRSRIWAAS